MGSGAPFPRVEIIRRCGRRRRCSTRAPSTVDGDGWGVKPCRSRIRDRLGGNHPTRRRALTRRRLDREGGEHRRLTQKVRADPREEMEKVGKNPATFRSRAVLSGDDADDVAKSEADRWFSIVTPSRRLPVPRDLRPGPRRCANRSAAWADGVNHLLSILRALIGAGRSRAEVVGLA